MVARYEALIRVSEALRAYHDRDTLFRSWPASFVPSSSSVSSVSRSTTNRPTPSSRTCSRPQGKPCRRQNCPPRSN